MPLLWAPVLRVVGVIILRRDTLARPLDARRPHTLRAHAQSRWHRPAGVGAGS